jgi:P-type Ca2+ transporter type 2C
LHHVALGLFQDFGMTRPDGDHPADWVKGMVIVVGVWSLNDWQKEN